MGGPIQNEKLFLFFDSGGLRLLIPQIFFVTLLSGAFEAALQARKEAWAETHSRTPHGKPVEISDATEPIRN